MGQEMLLGPLEMGGKGCSVTLSSAQQLNQTSKSKKWVRSFVPAATLRTWCVSLICFYLEVTYLLPGILFFSSPEPAAHVDSDFLRIPPNTASLSLIVEDACELRTQSRRLSRVSGQTHPSGTAPGYHPWVPAAAPATGMGRKPITIRSVTMLMKRIDV